MTNGQILQKALQKAYKDKNFRNPVGFYMLSRPNFWEELSKDTIYYGLIFNHSFAKAFWGTKVKEYKVEGGYSNCCGCSSAEVMLERWQYHLQKMVFKKEPLKYIERFL